MKLIYAIVHMTLFSCGHSYDSDIDERLTRVESLIESSPDSAASILDSIDVTGMRNHDEFRVRYLNGMARLAMNNYPAAAVSFMRAGKLAEDEGNDSLSALSCRALMDVYDRINDMSEKAHYAIRACGVYARHNDYDKMHDVLSALVMMSDDVPYRHTGEIIHYAKLLRDNDTVSINPTFDATTRGEELYLFLKDIDNLDRYRFGFADGLRGFCPGRFIEQIKAGDEWRDELLNDSTDISAPYAYLMAVTLVNQGYEKRAGEFLDFYRKNYPEKIKEYSIDPNTNRLHGIVTNRLIDPMSSNLCAEIRKDVMTAVTQFHYEEVVMQEHTIRFQRIIIAVIAALSVSIVTAISLYIKLTLARRRRREEAGMQAASELRTALELLEEQHLETLTHLCNAYYENYNNAKVNSRVARDTLDAIRRIAGQDSFYTRLESRLDSRSGGIMSMLRAEMPSLKDADLRLYLCNAIGLSIPAICLLLGEKREVIYTRRLRLRARIQGSDAPHKDILLKHLM